MQMMPSYSITPGTVEVSIGGQNASSDPVEVQTRLPPELTNSLSMQQWQAFRNDVNKVMQPMQRIKMVRLAQNWHPLSFCAVLKPTQLMPCACAYPC